MSQLPNGTEDMVGQNLTPATAYGVVNAGFQKLAQMNLHELVINFNGLVRDGSQRGKSALVIERLVQYIEIRCDGAAPSSGNLTVQLVVNGNLDGNVYTLNNGTSYVLVGAAGGGLVVPANQTLEARVTAGNQAEDVVVTLKSQMRIP